jgi:hypothetical protein
MRALVDWYFTAHPPIMHDLHEAQPLLYYLQRRAAAETRTSIRSSSPSCRSSRTSSCADDEVRACRASTTPRLHGRLVAGLSRLGRLQPQRHDAACTERSRAARERARAGCAGCSGAAPQRCRRAGAGGVPVPAGACTCAGGAAGALVRRGADAAAAARPSATRGGRGDVGGGAAAARRQRRRRRTGGGAEPRSRPAIAAAADAPAEPRPGRWRRTAARVVPRAADSAEALAQLLAPQQHELHADRASSQACS